VCGRSNQLDPPAHSHPMHVVRQRPLGHRNQFRDIGRVLCSPCCRTSKQTTARPQADRAQLDALGGEWQAYFDSETGGLREQLAAAQAAAGEAGELREQAQQSAAAAKELSSVRAFLAAVLIHGVCQRAARRLHRGIVARLT